MYFLFTGEFVVVTGASSGIGRAIAIEFARAGAALALVGRDRDALPFDDCTAAGGGPHVPYVADLLRDDSIEALTTAISSGPQRVRAIVHSAGIIEPGDLQSAAVTDFDRQYRCNVRAPWVLTQQLLPRLDASSDVVFINSSVGLTARRGLTQYAATKHGLRAVADGLRDEVNAKGVRVLSVFLGRTATSMQAALASSDGGEYEPERLIQPEDVANTVVHVVSLPRTVEVTDISLRPLMPPRQMPGLDQRSRPIVHDSTTLSVHA